MLLIYYANCVTIMAYINYQLTIKQITHIHTTWKIRTLLLTEKERSN